MATQRRSKALSCCGLVLRCIAGNSNSLALFSNSQHRLGTVEQSSAGATYGTAPAERCTAMRRIGTAQPCYSTHRPCAAQSRAATAKHRDAQFRIGMA